MAAQITHMLAALAALKEAEEAASGILSPKVLPYFFLGSQGPDIFYHNQRTKPSGLHFGALAHRHGYGSLLAAMAKSLAETWKADRGRYAGFDPPVSGSAEAAYLLGFATHAALDRACHPFIICKAGWVEAGNPSSLRRRGCHAFLERLLDRDLLKLRENQDPSDFQLGMRLGLSEASTYPSLESSALSRIQDIWARGLRASYPRSAGSDPLLSQRISNTFSDAIHFFVWTDPGNLSAEAGWKDWLFGDEGQYLVSILYPELPHAELDAQNLSNAEWPNPADGKARGESYPELISRGEREACRVIQAVLAYWIAEISEQDLAEIAGDQDLSLGAVPRFSAPLKLPEAMEAELKARRASLMPLR